MQQLGVHLRLSVKSNSNQNASFPKVRWIGNHPSVTFHFNSEVGRLLVASSNPHSCYPSTPGNCYCQRRFAINPRAAIKLLSFASLKEVEMSSNQERLRRIPEAACF